jgi:hypothetical protein
MLCPSGKELKGRFDAAGLDLAIAKQAMTDCSVPFGARDQRFQKAQKDNQSAASDYLEHKAKCPTCRANESKIRPRFIATP